MKQNDFAKKEFVIAERNVGSKEVILQKHESSQRDEMSVEKIDNLENGAP